MAEQRQLTSASADRAISAASTEKIAMTFLRNFNCFTHLSVHSRYFILKHLCTKNSRAGICFDCHSLGMLCLILTDDPGGLEGQLLILMQHFFYVRVCYLATPFLKPFPLYL